MAIDWTAADETVAAAVRARGIETDLSNAALAAVARAAVQEVDARVGNVAGISEWHAGGGDYIFLSKPAASVTSVTIDGEASAMDVDEYELTFGGRALIRFNAYGARSLWSDATVVYSTTAVADTDRYDRVVVDLVKLAITYDGSDKSHSAGDYSESASLTPDAYQREREVLIGELLGTRWGVA